MLNSPIVLVNFKNYKQGIGENALTLAQIVDGVQDETDVSFGVCVSAVDVARLVDTVSIPVFAQNFDGFKPGAHTGAILPEDLLAVGATGSLLNHSEFRRSKADIRDCIKVAKSLNFKVVCCAKSAEEGAELAEYGADLIAVEPPELIGGDVSVSKAQPEVIKKSVELIGGERLLVGAGIKTAEDLKIALEMGAAGVLIASGIVKAKDPRRVLVDLVNFEAGI